MEEVKKLKVQKFNRDKNDYAHNNVYWWFNDNGKNKNKQIRRHAGGNMPRDFPSDCDSISASSHSDSDLERDRELQLRSGKCYPGFCKGQMTRPHRRKGFQQNH